MKIQYIVGRPLKVGEDTLEPGDTLTAKQVAAIPKIDSYVASRRIYPVVSQADADRLPGFLRNQMNTKAEARAVIAKGTRDKVGEDKRSVEGNEIGKTDAQATKAAEQMKQQDLRYEQTKASESETRLRALLSAGGDRKEGKTLKIEPTVRIVPTPVPTRVAEMMAAKDEEKSAQSEDKAEAKDKKAADKAQDAAEDVKDSDGGTDEGPNVTAPETGAEDAVEDAPSETEVATAEGDTLEAGIDPSEMSVAQVRDYISTHPEEKDAILALEAAGKARKGLLED